VSSLVFSSRPRVTRGFICVQDDVGGNAGAVLGLAPMMATLAIGEAYFYDHGFAGRFWRLVFLVIAIVSAMGVIACPIRTPGTVGLVSTKQRDKWEKLHFDFARVFFISLMFYLSAVFHYSRDVSLVQTLGLVAAIVVFVVLLIACFAMLMQRGSAYVLVAIFSTCEFVFIGLLPLGLLARFGSRDRNYFRALNSYWFLEEDNPVWKTE
jgi:hypothetical protein